MLCNTFFVVAQQPELALDESEAKLVSDAYAEFSKHHDIPGVNAKRISEVNLAGAILTVFGTRAVAMFRNRRSKRAPKQAQVIGINNATSGTA
jgi:hypothetical protein